MNQEETKPARGGFREGSGRKRRVDEDKLIDKLDSIIDPTDAIIALSKKMIQGDIKAISLYLSYRYGKPVQTIDQTTNLSINDVDISKMIQFKKPNTLDDND